MCSLGQDFEEVPVFSIYLSGIISRQLHSLCITITLECRPCYYMCTVCITWNRASLHGNACGDIYYTYYYTHCRAQASGYIIIMSTRGFSETLVVVPYQL